MTQSIMDGETNLETCPELCRRVGGHYITPLWGEITNPGAGQTVTKYYMAGASRIALRKDGTLSYMLADHLGSTSLVTDASGNRTSELRYKPWGETRFSFGTMPIKYTFTGQFSYTDDPSTEGVTEGFGLMYYGARWYDNALGRFTQPDSVVPAGPQGYDRYAYTRNNPVIYTDPTGHVECDLDCQEKNFLVDPIELENGSIYSGCWGPQECLGVEPGTVVDRALDGEPGAIVDAVVPTTVGGRVQVEYNAQRPVFILGVPMPTSFSVGVNIVGNRVDGKISGNVDVTGEWGPSLIIDPMMPAFSAITGPTFTWFSSDVKQVTTGDSYVTSATISGGKAYSIAVSTPASTSPDPIYGVKPVTLFLGLFGAGTGYVSGGWGVSHTVWP